jgi:phosphatidylinositol-3-phosphatase
MARRPVHADRAAHLTAVTVAVLALAACSQPARTTSPTPPRPTPSAVAAPSPSEPSGSPASGPPAHIVVVVFENKSIREVTQSGQAPWFHDLIANSLVFTDSRAVTHPSQPNYLALFSGSTQGITDDHCPVNLGDRPNLARQLLDAGLGFAGYSEDLPGPGSPACGGGRYARKHNPWSDFANVPASANQPLRAFPSTFDSLPTVSFVIPNLCDDMHDCSVGTGDTWAAAHLDGYRRWAASHGSLLVVTFDEDDNSSANQILTVVTGAGVRPGQYPQRVDHYTVLRAIEDCYGLAPLGAAASAPSIPGICPPRAGTPQPGTSSRP